MVLTAPGLAAGTEVTFEVKQDGVDTPIGTVTATSEAGKATADWSTWFKQEAVGDPQTVNADNGEKFTAVTFSFKASASGKDSTTTKSVAYGDKVTWNLVDPDGKPVPKTLVSVCLPYGTLTVTSDDNGAINLDGLPPGEAHVTVD